MLLAAIKTMRFRTGYIGKWHLGTLMRAVDGKTQGPANVDYERPLKIGKRTAKYRSEFAFCDSFLFAAIGDLPAVLGVTLEPGVGEQRGNVGAGW